MELLRRKSFHTLGSPFTCGDGVWRRGSFGATEESAATGAEGKVERFPHRGSVLTSTHQPERLLYSPARVGGGWELRLQDRKSTRLNSSH